MNMLSFRLKLEKCLADVKSEYAIINPQGSAGHIPRNLNTAVVMANLAGQIDAYGEALSILKQAVLDDTE